MYHYRCNVVRVVDGDTLDLEIDLGFHVSIVKRARLIGIDAPEMRGDTLEAGRAAKVQLDLLAGPQDALHCKTYLDRTDKYGRILVDLYYVDDAESINQKMVGGGYAVAREW